MLATVKPYGAAVRASAAASAARIRGWLRSMPPVRVAPIRAARGSWSRMPSDRKLASGAVEGAGEPPGHAGQAGDDLGQVVPGPADSAVAWCCARWPPRAARARLWCKPSAAAARNGSAASSGRTEVSRSRCLARAARWPGPGAAGSSARTPSAARGSVALPASDVPLSALGCPGAALVDKRVAYERASVAEVPILPRRAYDSTETMRAAADELPHPAVAKAVLKTTTVGLQAHILTTPAERADDAGRRPCHRAAVRGVADAGRLRSGLEGPGSWRSRTSGTSGCGRRRPKSGRPP
jgi:hypothetical protein